MNIKPCCLTLLLLGVIAVSGPREAGAQPDPNNQPKAANPAGQAPFGGAGNWQNMTPEQRRVATQQFVEQLIRGSMDRLGFRDKAMQDTVLNIVAEQEVILDTVREEHRKVARALMEENVTDREVADAMADLQTAIREAKVQRAATIAALEEQLEFSKQPKLAAFLSLSGVTGDESVFIAGVAGNFMSAIGNLAAAPAQ